MVWKFTAEIALFAVNLGFTAEVKLFVANFWNWVVCSELTFAAELCVVQRIWDWMPKLNCLQWIWNSLPKLSCLQRINIRCRIVCFEENLGFAAEVVWSAANFIWNSLPKLSCLQWINIRSRIVCFGANLGFAAEVVLSAANLWLAAGIELSVAN
jgi:hypothetical protein